MSEAVKIGLIDQPKKRIRELLVIPIVKSVWRSLERRTVLIKKRS